MPPARLQQQQQQTNTTASSTIVGAINTTVTFPSYAQLMSNTRVGDYFCSQPFTVVNDNNGDEYDFLVKLYPRGGGHASKYTAMNTDINNKSNNNSNNNNNNNQDDRRADWLKGLLMQGQRPSNPLTESVGVYLQYLPRQHQMAVDATFALRLRGNQATGPRFDVEWRAGMRFVAANETTKLAKGLANDFGALLLRTILLDDFLGIQEKDYTDANYNKPVHCQVQVFLHQRPATTMEMTQRDVNNNNTAETQDKRAISLGLKALSIPDLRQQETDDEPLRVGQVVVPVLQRLDQRPRLLQLGAYPGVEFRIMRMIDPVTEEDVFFHRPGGLDYELKPIYPLVPQLERPWPVRVPQDQIPKLVSAAQYNTISAVGSLFTAVTGLLTAFIVSQAISVFFIPSRSMEPTLQVGDALLVEKITPRLFPNSIQSGQVVLFHPPTPLQEIVARSGGRISDRDLFVKRVAAAEVGTVLSVSPAGDVQLNGQELAGRRDLCTAEPLRLIERYVKAGDQTVKPGQVAVLGDCAAVSVDSRVWGGLPVEDIVGRPLFRIWPLSRMGPIGNLPTTQADYWKDGDGTQETKAESVQAPAF